MIYQIYIFFELNIISIIILLVYSLTLRNKIILNGNKSKTNLIK